VEFVRVRITPRRHVPRPVVGYPDACPRTAAPRVAPATEGEHT